MPKIDFKLKYEGRRFEKGRLPLDVLGDLSAFRDLIVYSAKSAWLSINEGRQRVPKGFTESIRVSLVDVEEGSAVPVLRWEQPESPQAKLMDSPKPVEEILHQAYRDVIEVISANDNPQTIARLSAVEKRHLRKLGSSLLEGEAIVFNAPDIPGAASARVDLNTRSRYLRAVAANVERRVDGVAVLKDNLSSSGEIHISSDEYGLISIPISRDEILEEYDGSIENEVEFSILAEFDDGNKLLNVVEVYSVALISRDSSQHYERIAKLQALKKGWDNRGGEPISQKTAESALQFLTQHSIISDIARVYPSNAGELLFEFEYAGYDLTIEFASGRNVEVYGFKLDDEDTEIHNSFRDLTSEVAEFIISLEEAKS